MLSSSSPQKMLSTPACQLAAKQKLSPSFQTSPVEPTPQFTVIPAAHQVTPAQLTTEPKFGGTSTL